MIFYDVFKLYDVPSIHLSFTIGALTCDAVQLFDEYLPIQFQYIEECSTLLPGVVEQSIETMIKVDDTIGYRRRNEYMDVHFLPNAIGMINTCLDLGYNGPDDVCYD